MTAHDPSLGRQGGLLGWLGLGPRPTGDATSEPEPAPTAPARERRLSLRDRQLDEIKLFLASHQLEVTAQTLSIAHSYLTSADPHLVRLIDRQVHARKAVTVEWLDEFVGLLAAAK